MIRPVSHRRRVKIAAYIPIWIADDLRGPRISADPVQSCKIRVAMQRVMFQHIVHAGFHKRLRASHPI